VTDINNIDCEKIAEAPEATLHRDVRRAKLELGKVRDEGAKIKDLRAFNAEKKKWGEQANAHGPGRLSGKRARCPERAAVQASLQAITEPPSAESVADAAAAVRALLMASTTRELRERVTIHRAAVAAAGRTLLTPHSAFVIIVPEDTSKKIHGQKLLYSVQLQLNSARDPRLLTWRSAENAVGLIANMNAPSPSSTSPTTAQTWLWRGQTLHAMIKKLDLGELNRSLSPAEAHVDETYKPKSPEK
jgi:hypothetical protein